MRLLPPWPRSYESGIEKKFDRDLRYPFFSRITNRHPRIFLRILARRDLAQERHLEAGAGQRSCREFVLWLLSRLFASLLKPAYAAKH